MGNSQSSQNTFDSLFAFLRRELSNPWTLFLIIIAIFIFSFKIIVSIRGVNTPWYKNVQGTQFINPVLSGLTWAVAYFLSIIGLIYLNYIHRGLEAAYISALFVVALALGLFWDCIFFYGRDIKFSLLLYLFIVLFYAWFFYSIYKISVVASLFQLPFLLRAIWFFISIGVLFVKNPSDTILPY